jgi:hypothetical protein
MFDGKPFPVKCLRCDAVDGWPTQAQTGTGVIVVNFRCRSCDFEWLDTIATSGVRPPVVPIVERRKTPRYRG